MSAFSLLRSPKVFTYFLHTIHRTFCYPYSILYVPEYTYTISRRFGTYLELRDIVGAFMHRPVSYYAIIIRWLLPSLLPGCQSVKTSFPTQIWFGNLSVRSGLFPSRHRTFAPCVCLHYIWYGYLEFSWRQSSFGPPVTKKCSTPHTFYNGLYLNRFRRKPAISRFDWLFTPRHMSSPSIATDVSEVL